MGKIQISSTDLVGIMVRASLIESAKTRLIRCREELKAIEEENENYMKDFMSKYGLKREDRYKINQEGCYLQVIP